MSRRYSQGMIDAYCERHGIDPSTGPTPQELYEDDLESGIRAAKARGDYNEAGSLRHDLERARGE